MLPILLLKRYWRESVIGLLVVALLLAALAARQAHFERDTARAKAAQVEAAYAHPATSSATSGTKTTGPTRVVERIVRRMTLEEFQKENPAEAARFRDQMTSQWLEVIDRETTTGGTTETSATAATSKPDAGPIAAAAPVRTNRLLLGGQLVSGGYAAIAGYSFSNRLDLLGGYGHDGPLAQVIIRF